MDDLIAFLRAQLDADEQETGYEQIPVLGPGDDPENPSYVRGQEKPRSKFITADIEAKRLILDWLEQTETKIQANAEEHTRAMSSAYLDKSVIPGLRRDGWQLEGMRRALLGVAELLTKPYADREGFQERWRS